MHTPGTWIVPCSSDWNMCLLAVLAYAIASVSPNMDVANAALPAYVTSLLFFVGLLLRIQDQPNYWKWYGPLFLCSHTMQGGTSAVSMSPYVISASCACASVCMASTCTAACLRLISTLPAHCWRI